MKEFLVIPLQTAVGVVLGMPKNEVHEKIGKPENVYGNAEYYQPDLAFSIHYDLEANVEYIEISKPEIDVIILLEGIDIFKTPAAELISLIEKTTLKKVDKTKSEIPYSFIFPDLELSLWRPTIPENETDADGKYFETIGIGIQGYYSN